MQCVQKLAWSPLAAWSPVRGMVAALGGSGSTARWPDDALWFAASGRVPDRGDRSGIRRSCEASSMGRCMGAHSNMRGKFEQGSSDRESTVTKRHVMSLAEAWRRGHATPRRLMRATPSNRATHRGPARRPLRARALPRLRIRRMRESVEVRERGEKRAGQAMCERSIWYTCCELEHG